MGRKAFVSGALAVGLVAVTCPTATSGGRAGSPAGQFGQILKHAQQVHDLEMTDEDEQKLGTAVSERIRQRYGVVQDPAVHKYVTMVGLVLAHASDRPNLPWKFVVLDTDGVNALAAPGGYVHITRGALSLMKNEAELAGVLGHEIIHVTEKHTMKAIQKGKAIQLGANETLSGSPEVFNKLVDKATDAVMAGFGRNEELEADEKGVVVANKSGYDPKGLSAFLTSLAERNKDASGKQGLFASHPEMDERLKKLDKTIAGQKLDGTVALEARFQEHVPYKKSGFGLSKLMSPSSGGEQKSAEVTGSGAARGVDTERNAKGGPNPSVVTVKVTAAELTSFKKEGKLS